MNLKTTNESVFARRESNVRSYSRSFPVKFVRASGANMFDKNGGKYLDFLAGCSSLNYGHNHPVLKQALQDYISRDGLTHGLDMENDIKEEFLETFEQRILHSRQLDYVVQFPGPTGANAVETALKIARKVTGRTNVIAFTNGFHGCTLGALALTGNQHHRQGAGLPLTHISRMPYANYFGDETNTIDQIDHMLSDPSSGVDAPAAFIFETVQGEGGLNVASFPWMRRLEAVARKHGAVLIVDDIQAGVGRTGSFFSFEKAGIKPDIVTLAKSISGYGLPMALTLIKRDLDVWQPGEHNGTFRGNCHAFVTAKTSLDYFWNNSEFEIETQKKGRMLQKHLETIKENYPELVRDIKGRGMMLGLDVKSGEVASNIIKECFSNRLIIETSGPEDEIVKFLMPLTITESEMEEGLDIVDTAIKNTLEKKIKAAA